MLKYKIATMMLCIITACSSAFAVELDDDVELGGFTPNMTLEEADEHAGGVGQRECKTWSPNPTVHWCRWSYSDETQHVEIDYGPDGVIFGLSRRLPLPDGMDDAAAFEQVKGKLARYGRPSTSIIRDNLHWGCKGDDCGGPRMIRVWVMEAHQKFFNGKRHLTIEWVNRERSDLNRQRFDRESKSWQERQVPSEKKHDDGKVKHKLDL